MTLALQEVRPEHLSPGVLALFYARGVPKGPWASGFPYSRQDLVTDGSRTLICMASHTSAANLVDDIDAGRWMAFSQATNVPLEIESASETLDATVADRTALWNSPSNATWTLAGDAPLGTRVVVVQVGNGEVSFIAGGGATLFSRYDSEEGDHRTTDGRGAYVSCEVVQNTDGVSALWFINGQTKVGS